MSSTAFTNGKEPLMKRPKKKKKKKPSLALTPTSSQSTPITSLPDDLLLSCFARISRLHYPALSLVSKSFRSLLASPELYETRSLLGRAESCLYVCLKYYPDHNYRWFTLCQKPSRTKTNDDTSEKKKKDKSSGHLLVPIAIPNSPQVYQEGVVTVGSTIYAIGRPINHSPSSSLWILDFNCHVWRKAPSMLVERYYPAADVVDGKIYVAGGCEEINSSNWMEVFDPKTQTWEIVLCPLAERYCSNSVNKSAVVEGRIFYMFGNDGVAYKPEEDSWEAIERPSDLELRWLQFSDCVIDNVLCRLAISDVFEWYDFKRQSWISMRSLRGLPKFGREVIVQMADYGGKMAVFSYNPSSGHKGMAIWCEVISLERRKSRNGDGDGDDEEIWGTVEWLGPVLTLPDAYFYFMCAIASTL
ncbi:unnamed protein product [Microthlaspi erraticum]|uniref:F-box domain-containing protein n=1 Tax=Microthlaspi erraticum TaxID=1685480 RepID=A0A6D2KTD3_9BRAS|nr:unnamed protein product [Microthlaspi erraticum]